MVCIYCKHETTVTNSRSGTRTPGTWRRRQCKHCGAIFTTRETPDLGMSIRVKSNTSLEPFSRAKLFVSIYHALSHRQNPETDAESLSDTIESVLLNQQIQGLITRRQIQECTLQTLQRFDPIAATFYQAHHRVEIGN